jgi:hypothetical protein
MLMRCLAEVSLLKELIRDIGMEVVILWNAVMLKKRILVVDEDVKKILDVTRTLPQLASHRSDWSILRPLVLDDSSQVEDLETSGVYIAGATSNAAASLLGRGDLFDVILSLADHRVTVSNAATATMKMCSIHKDLANAMKDAVASEISTKELNTLVSSKTKTILSNLKSLAVEDEHGKHKISDAAIQESSKNEATQQWLRRLAIAENLM